MEMTNGEREGLYWISNSCRHPYEDSSRAYTVEAKRVVTAGTDDDPVRNPKASATSIDKTNFLMTNQDGTPTVRNTELWHMYTRREARGVCSNDLARP